MKWLKNISVMKKLVTGFVLVALISGVVGFAGIRNILIMDRAGLKLYENATLPILYTGHIAESYQKMRVALRDILRTKDVNVIIKSGKTIEDINIVVMGYLEKLDKSSTDKKQVEELKSSYVDIYNLIKKVAKTAEEEKPEAVNALMTSASTAAALARIDNAVNSVYSTGETFAKNTAEENSSLTEIAIKIMLATIVFAFFTAIFLGLIISINIRSSIKKGLDFSKKLAAGDFSDRIDIDQKDEMGQLGTALNKAADDLEKLVTDIIIGSQNLVQAIQEVTSGNENLSQRTSEQASSLEEIASTIEQAVASMNQNAENSRVANDIASKTIGLAEDGGTVVYQAVDAINEIDEASKKIESIISAINDISFQTNLLALNAAVEAARAGEQGRGFAVVAGEVRNLAQRSGNAAKEISGLIKSTMHKVERGTSLANRSGESLKEIISSIKNVGKYIAEIAATSEEQKIGSSQISTAVAELDSMTQQNAGLVEETASASEEIANQANELLAMMEKFKISEHMPAKTK